MCVACLNRNTQAYWHLNALCNTALKQDHELFWANKSQLMEAALSRNNYGTVCKELCTLKAGPRNRSSLINDRHGNILNTKAECPITTADPQLQEDVKSPVTAHPCNVEDVILKDVWRTAYKLKNSHTARISGKAAEMIKHGGDSIL